MTLRIDDFKSAFVGGGARTNLFRCRLYWPNAEIAGQADDQYGSAQPELLQSFMIKSASLPGSTIGFVEVPFRGRKLKVSGDRTFDDYTVTIVNDNNFAVRNAMERWHDAISGNVSNVSGRGLDSATFDSYTANIEVEQLGRDGQVIKNYRMIGAWPTTVDPIDVSYDNSDTIEEFGVTFAYQWFESGTTEAPTTSGFIGR